MYKSITFMYTDTHTYVYVYGCLPFFTLLYPNNNDDVNQLPKNDILKNYNRN